MIFVVEIFKTLVGFWCSEAFLRGDRITTVFYSNSYINRLQNDTHHIILTFKGSCQLGERERKT